MIGRDLAFDERYADGEIDRIPSLISELLRLKIRVLATPSTPITLAAQRATSTVPIVSVTADPVGTGLVASLSRPGGNITGLSLLSGDYSAKWLELLKEVMPNLNNVAVLWRPDNPASAREMDHLQETARSLGFNLAALPMKSGDVETSFATIANGSFGGLVVVTDASLEQMMPRIIGFAAQHRIPTIYPFSTAIQQGGLMSYSSDFYALWRRAASHVDRVLKGERPADIPIEQATAVSLKINLKTAKALGLTVPPTLLARADEVIE
jgi:putative ABC transport system substrate-binding protein